MKIYLAAPYKSNPKMRKIRDRLEEMGHQVTSRWIEGKHAMSDGDTAQAQRFALDDIEDLQKAKALVVFIDNTKNIKTTRGGCHTEFGYALAIHRLGGSESINMLHLVSVGDYERNVFHYLPGVSRFKNVKKFLKAVEDGLFDRR